MGAGGRRIGEIGRGIKRVEYEEGELGIRRESGNRENKNKRRRLTGDKST